jgi:hypothetical protein
MRSSKARVEQMKIKKDSGKYIATICDCGEEIPFTGWVFAHWHEPIKFVCPSCKREATLFEGQIIESEGGE